MLVTCLSCKKPVFVSAAAMASGEALIACGACRAELLVDQAGAVCLASGRETQPPGATTVFDSGQSVPVPAPAPPGGSTALAPAPVPIAAPGPPAEPSSQALPTEPVSGAEGPVSPPLPDLGVVEALPPFSGDVGSRSVVPDLPEPPTPRVDGFGLSPASETGPEQRAPVIAAPAPIAPAPGLPGLIDASGAHAEVSTPSAPFATAPGAPPVIRPAPIAEAPADAPGPSAGPALIAPAPEPPEAEMLSSQAGATSATQSAPRDDTAIVYEPPEPERPFDIARELAASARDEQPGTAPSAPPRDASRSAPAPDKRAPKEGIGTGKGIKGIADRTGPDQAGSGLTPTESPFTISKEEAQALRRADTAKFVEFGAKFQQIAGDAAADFGPEDGTETPAITSTSDEEALAAVLSEDSASPPPAWRRPVDDSIGIHESGPGVIEEPWEISPGLDPTPKAATVKPESRPTKPDLRRQPKDPRPDRRPPSPPDPPAAARRSARLVIPAAVALVGVVVLLVVLWRIGVLGGDGAPPSGAATEMATLTAGADAEADGFVIDGSGLAGSNDGEDFVIEPEGSTSDRAGSRGTRRSGRTAKGPRSEKGGISGYGSRADTGPDDDKSAKAARTTRTGAPAAKGEKASREDPGQDPAEEFYRLGNRHLKEKQAALAITTFKKCLTLNPRHGLAYRSLGVAYYMLGRETDAIQAYSRFVFLAPEHKDVSKVREIIRTYEQRQKR